MVMQMANKFHDDAFHASVLSELGRRLQQAATVGCNNTLEVCTCSCIRRCGHCTMHTVL